MTKLCEMQVIADVGHLGGNRLQCLHILDILSVYSILWACCLSIFLFRFVF